MKSLNTGNVSYFLLRVLFGSLIVFHGYGKLAGFNEKVNLFADPLDIGQPLSLSLVIFAEFICGILILIGFKVRITAIPVLGTMIVAFFVAHKNDPFGVKEPAFIYLCLSVILILNGSGKYSVDELLAKFKGKLKSPALPVNT